MKTILLVEDNIDDIFLVRRALGRAGVRVRVQTVPDGEEALAYLKGHSQYSDRQQFPFPDLTLLDIKMPKKNGLEVLEEVRKDDRLTRLLVVFLTSSDERSDIDRAFDLHANSYLVKSGELDFMGRLMEVLEEYWLTLNKRPTCPDVDAACN